MGFFAPKRFARVIVFGPSAGFVLGCFMVFGLLLAPTSLLALVSDLRFDWPRISVPRIASIAVLALGSLGAILAVACTDRAAPPATGKLGMPGYGISVTLLFLIIVYLRFSFPGIDSSGQLGAAVVLLILLGCSAAGAFRPFAIAFFRDEDTEPSSDQLTEYRRRGLLGLSVICALFGLCSTVVSRPAAMWQLEILWYLSRDSGRESNEQIYFGLQLIALLLAAPLALMVGVLSKSGDHVLRAHRIANRYLRIKTAAKVPRCASCGYELAGLRPDSVCPECGATRSTKRQDVGRGN